MPSGIMRYTVNSADSAKGKGHMLRQRQSGSPQIQEMVERIVERYHPDRVILFGSHARGEGTTESDVDLLVVMPFAGSRRHKQCEMRLALHDFNIPKDLVVTRPEDFAWRKEVVGTIEYPAAHEGKVLYAKA